MGTFYKDPPIRGVTAAGIADSIEARLRAGRLEPGAALPAVRALAQELSVSPNTVAAAYARLRDAGLVHTDGRRGTRVAPAATAAEVSFALPRGLRDLASGNVDGRLLQAIAPAWMAELGVLDGHDVTGDSPALVERARLAITAQGLPADEIGVFSGTLDAVERVLRLRTRPGAAVMVEDPCWPPLLGLLSSLRLKPVPLPLDGEGAVLPTQAELAACAAIVLTPRAQNPTATSMGAARMAQLCRLLKRCPGTLLILDDHWGQLAASPLPPLDPLPAHWLYLASVSKFLGPDLRVAAVAGSRALLQDLRRQQALGPRWVSLLLQNLAARLWDQAQRGRLPARMGRNYAQRRLQLAQALQAHGVAVPEAGDGLHLWLPVKDEATVAQAMACAGWAVQPGRPFRLHSPPAVRVSLGNLDAADIPPLAAGLAQALQLPARAVS